jgi:ribosomal protein S18 acetylase RimI-like enzyme
VRILFHPATVAVYVLLLALLIRVSGVLRTRDWGRLVLFTASLSAGFLLTVEWVTRNYFEAKATDMVQSDSLANMQKYFGKDHVLVATLGGDEVIGVVALEVVKKDGIIWYWHVKSQYRNRGLGWDLVEMVIEQTKGTKKNALQRISCETYNLQNRAEKSLKDHGFERTGDDVREPHTIGWFGICRRTWVKKL